MNSIYQIIFATLFAACSGAVGTNHTVAVKQVKDTALQDTIVRDTVVSVKDTLVISGVGDMMLGTNYPDKSYLKSDDGASLLQPVLPFLQRPDLMVGNHEGVILDRGGIPKNCKNPKNCFAFRSPNRYVQYFKDAGFHVLGLANNHINDFGDTGRLNTAKVLQEAGIHHAGTTEIPYTIFEKDGVKYGFCAFAPNNGTIKIYDIANAQAIVRKLDAEADIVIVAMHIGAEGRSYTSVTRKTEIFLNENRGNPYKFAREMIDAGADIIFGHGPHVVRAVDLYKNRFIAYSLGNFATWGRINVDGPMGLAPIVEVSVKRNGEFVKANVISTRQHGDGGPVPDSTAEAFQTIKKYTLRDIPEAPLEFGNDGSIFPKAG